MYGPYLERSRPPSWSNFVLPVGNLAQAHHETIVIIQTAQTALAAIVTTHYKNSCSNGLWNIDVSTEWKR